MPKLIHRLAALSALLLCGCATPAQVVNAYKRGLEDGRREVAPKVTSITIPTPEAKMIYAPWVFPVPRTLPLCDLKHPTNAVNCQSAWPEPFKDCTMKGDAIICPGVE